MTKQYFWPLSLIIFGTIMAATILGFLPMYLLWFWPVVMLLVGLGALLVADRDEWMMTSNGRKTGKKLPKRRR